MQQLRGMDRGWNVEEESVGGKTRRLRVVLLIHRVGVIPFLLVLKYPQIKIFIFIFFVKFDGLVGAV